MRVAIVLGKGVEGCGVTRCAIEFAKYHKDTTVFATVDKVWSRKTEIKSVPVKLGDETEYQKLVEALNSHDVVLFYSIPSKKHPQPAVDNFARLIDDIKVKMVAVHHDHSSKTLHDNAHIVKYFSSVDLVIAHSEHGALAEWMKKNNISTPIKEMGLVGFGFDEARSKYWKPIGETRDNVVRWIGRTAMWKGPELIIDLHNDYLKEAGMITILEGLEASIQYALVMYHDGHDKTQPRALRDHFRKKKPFKYGEELPGEDAYCYHPYVNSEMMERLSTSAFSSNLYHLKPSMYGKNIENCHAECASSGAVPIFHKHFGDNVIHRVTGDPFTRGDSGTIWFDPDDRQKTAELIKELSKDPGKRNEWREKAFEYWKAQANNEIIIETILDAIRETPKSDKINIKQPPTLEGFFK